MSQKSLEGFLSPDSKFKVHRLASTSKRKAEDIAEPARKKSRQQQGAANARGDLGEKATAKELAEEGETAFNELMRTIEHGTKEPLVAQGQVILYWMRMKDLRIADNRALSSASALAQTEKKPLSVVHVLSPNDFKAHRRAARRIDFVLRNLQILKADLNELNIPLQVISVVPRKSLPGKVVEYAQSLQASHIFANIEYEVDELEQLTKVYTKAKEQNIQPVYFHDHCIITPGKLTTGQNKPYSVFSPWYRKWCDMIAASPGKYLDEEPTPVANPASVRKQAKLQAMFDSEVPESVAGFEMDDENKKKMLKWWPAGEKAAEAALNKFVQEKKDEVAKGNKSIIAQYKDNRSRPDLDVTSRLSPYIAAGIISTRAVLRGTLPLNKNKLQVDKNTAIGTWVSEVSWRDFYQHLMAAFPRVVKGHAFQTKYDKVIWEYNDELVEAWKQGKTGFPLIDAGMRQVVEEGWMHNRVRMNAASFLSKDLMEDWRVGERFFMENLIDGDFGSNNGGWQWSSGTGSDPQPFFRIFNPFSQSEKFDPSGDYIRKYVPELSKLKGKAIHNPYEALSKADFAKLGYPKPICDHAKARKRAIARFKNIGEAVEE